MSKTLISLCIIAFIAGVYIFSVAPIAEKREYLRKNIEMNYLSLKKLEKHIERAKKAGFKLEDAVKELEDMERHIIHTTDMPLAFAELQMKVQDMAENAGIIVLSIKSLPAIDYNAYKGIPIYLDSAGNIKQVSEFLKSLDSTRDLISIERLDVAIAKQGSYRMKMQILGLMKI